MNILCVIDSLGSGGAQRQLVGLAAGFKERGHEVSFLTYHEVSFFKPVLDRAGIPVTCIQESNYLKRFFKMRRYIRKGNFDTVLSFLEAANFICELSGLPFRKWKLIVGERNANINIFSSFKLKMYRWFHVFADYVVSNSKSNIDIVRKINIFLKSKKCYVIYNTVDLTLWKPLIYKNNNPKNVKTILVLASQIYRKNLKGLVDALLLLDKQDLKKFKILWYGDKIKEPYFDNSFPESFKRIKQNNLNQNIQFFPATSNVQEVILKSDVIGLFSFNEGLPNAICEAMACGKPVICSDIADMKIILSHQKVFLFDPKSPEKIASVIQEVINKPINQLEDIGRSNRKIAEKLFNKEKIVTQYLNLLTNE